MVYTGEDLHLFSFKTPILTYKIEINNTNNINVIRLLLDIMPRNAKNYSNTHIYKFICKDSSIKNCYVGHTVNFSDRKAIHKSDYIKSPERRLYKCISENGGWDNWDMILIETINCKNNSEAKLREGYWIKELNADLNMNKSVFISSDGVSTDDIVADNKKEQNKLKTNFRQKKEKEELQKLQIENQTLKDELQKIQIENQTLKDTILSQKLLHKE